MQKLEAQQQDGYSHYNYALLHSTGLRAVFNFMSYNRAFVARRADFERLLEASDDYSKWATRRWSILICCYDWKGKTQPSWREEMLLSDQELEYTSDVMTLMELNSDSTNLRPPRKLKWRHVLEITAPLKLVLRVMYENHAFPYEEVDANVIERALPVPDGRITVKLANYLPVEMQWANLPPN